VSRADLRPVAVAAEDLSDAQRARIGALIVSGFPLAPERIGRAACEQWAARAWRTTPALAHFVVADGDALVAQQSLLTLTVPDCPAAYGLGDLVVAESHRGRGFARALITATFADARARGAQRIYTRTDRLAGVFASLGFAHDRDAARHSDERGRPVNDLWAWHAPGVTPTPALPTPADF